MKVISVIHSLSNLQVVGQSFLIFRCSTFDVFVFPESFSICSGSACSYKLVGYLIFDVLFWQLVSNCNLDMIMMKVVISLRVKNCILLA